MECVPFDIVVFDLDGTLADTAPDLAVALNRTLAALGRESIPADTVRGMIGHGARTLLRRGLAATGEAPEGLVDEAYPLLLDHYAGHICHETRAYPEVERTLDALAEAGMKLAICTNKPEALSRHLVEALGWNGRFYAIVGGDTLPLRKPDPAMLHEAIARAGGGRAAFVGDSAVDARTARAANVPFIAVSFGYSDVPAQALGANMVIDSYAALLPALARLNSLG